MTNEETKKALLQNGLTVADIEKFSEKFDTEKITEIVEKSANPNEAFEALHVFYPELEVENLQKQCDFVMEQVEAALKEKKNTGAMELTEEELDNVAGGGWFSDVGNWFKNNWKAVAVGAAIVVGSALVCTGVGAVVGAVIAKAAASAAASALTTAVAAAGCGAVTISSASVATVVAAGAASGALVGAGVGTVIGGAVTGALGATGVLGKVN